MQVDIDRSSLNSAKSLLFGVKEQSPKVMSRALNATASKGKTLSNKEIRKQVNLSAAYVRDHMTVKRASYRKLVASISTPSRGLLLSYYLYGVTGINQDTGRATSGALFKYKKGMFSIAALDQPLRVKINPNQAPKTLDPTKWFILPRLKNSNLPALARRKNGKLKIHGPSLSQVYSDVIGEISGPLNDYLAEQMDKQIDSVLRGY
jgi:hypothetical protein